MPRYKFKWTNLDDGLLRGLCRDLGLGVAEPDKTLTYRYGARPTDDFVRETWPHLRDRWLAKDPLSRGSVVDALWSLGLGEGEPPAHKAEQMSFLLGRNNARRLREVVLDAFIALGETTKVDQNPNPAPPVPAGGRVPTGPRPVGPTKSHNGRERKVSPTNKKQEGIGLEAALWDAANQLRSNMDAAEYKHVVLGVIFLKYVSDVFASRQATLAAAVADPASDYFMPTESARRATLEDRDEYTSEGVFWVPEGHRWDDLRKAGKQPNIGQRIDAAMDAIERENPTLRGVLPKTYGRRELTTATLGGLIDTFSRDDLATAENADMDILGRVFEYMVGQFASAEGKLGGEFYTPRSVVNLLVEMLEPFQGRVFDPAAGSGGMFVQADRFVRAHGGVRNDIAIYGQEQNPTTWRLAKMNMALRGIDANLGPQWGDSFGNDLHPDLRADFILANPPFNISQWGGENLRDDPRWKYGTPPAGNANFAWIQHMLHHLAPTGTMATVLSNGSLSSQQSGEGEIRKNLAEADLVECIVAMPGQLFYTTTIEVSLWFLTKDKTDRKVASERPQRNRQGEVLFIDARQLGHMVSRVNKELSDEDLALITNTYHAWRGEPHLKTYEDVPGFCSSATLDDIRKHHHILTPGRYVGSEAAEDDEEPLKDKIARLTQEIREGFKSRVELQDRVVATLDSLRVAVDD